MQIITREQWGAKYRGGWGLHSPGSGRHPVGHLA